MRTTNIIVEVLKALGIIQNTCRSCVAGFGLFISNLFRRDDNKATNQMTKLAQMDELDIRIYHPSFGGHSWVQVDGEAPDKPLDSLVLGRMKQFSAMKKLKKMALRVIAQRLRQEEIAGLKKMFKMIDTDNSGQITYEELKAGLKRFGANLSESEFGSLMQAADVNNSGTIDYQEFIAATLHLNMIEREDNLLATFYKICI